MNFRVCFLEEMRHQNFLSRLTDLYLVILCYCVSIVRKFRSLSHIFCKNLNFLDILPEFLFGFGIRFWAVDNLGSGHHASIVCFFFQTVHFSLVETKIYYAVLYHCMVLETDQKWTRFHIILIWPVGYTSYLLK